MPEPSLTSPLPLPTHLDRVFAPLCVALPPVEALQLKQDLAAHIEKVHRSVLPDALLDLGQAARIKSVLDTLLDDYARYAEPQRRLVIGAIRYFTQTRDAEPDTTSLMGFDDDMEVVNHVLLAVGRADLSAKLL
jgi:uncharacterized membrane protein YkvA (DUF1232 family)